VNDQHTPPATCWLGVPGLPTPGATPTFAVPTSWLPSVASNLRDRHSAVCVLAHGLVPLGQGLHQAGHRLAHTAQRALPSNYYWPVRVDAGEQAGAQQQILDLVWLSLSISSIRHSATVRFAAGELRDESLQVGVASQPRSAWTVTSASTPCRPSASGELKSWRSPMTRTRRECLRVSDTAPRPKRPPQASASSASARESLESGDNLSPGWGQAWVRREAAGTGQRSS